MSPITQGAPLDALAAAVWSYYQRLSSVGACAAPQTPMKRRRTRRLPKSVHETRLTTRVSPLEVWVT